MVNWHTDEQKLKIIVDICDAVIERHLSFNEAVEASPISRVTFYQWIARDKELQSLYNYAREIRSDILFEEIIDISNNTEEGEEIITKPSGTEFKRGDMIRHRQLKIDARKWVVSKMNPKKYGDKLDVTTNGEKINAADPFAIIRQNSGINEETKTSD